MVSRTGFVSSVVGSGLMALSGFSSTAAAGVFASGVVEYVPGNNVSASLQHSGAAVGLPTSVDGGDVSPFTPPFSTSNIVIIGPTGHITLQLSAPITEATGEEIGVFTNTGLPTKNVGGVITAGTGTLGQADTAIISVSQNGVDWVALNSGNPLDLTMPSNAFNDAVLSGTGSVSISGGTAAANPFEPFHGTLAEFSGLTYPQMQTVFAGSFGGAWVDASSAGLSEIDYVRFDVPTGDRLVLDAVTGVPEPATAAVLLGGALVLLRRRRSAGPSALASVVRNGAAT